ncbi:MAG: PepSY domain-containing protein [Pseudothermotoga sp.]
MRKTIFLVLLFFTTIVLTQNDPVSLVKRINELSDLYKNFDLNALKISILDAINNSKEKDVVAVYLDFVNSSPVWVVQTPTNRIRIDPYTGKIISTQSYSYRASTYAVSLKDAISLAFISIGKGIYYAFFYDENTWLIGSKEQLVHVSTKTPVVLSTQKREGQLKTPGGGKK